MSEKKKLKSKRLDIKDNEITLFSGPITSPRTALKRMFTFSHELTRGSVRVI